MRGVLRVLLSLALAATSTAYFLAEKRVTLADDGRVRSFTTFAPTVGDALDRLGVEVGPDDVVRPSVDSDLEGARRIEVHRAKDVVVVLNGSRSVERVTGRTVAQILDQLSVEKKGAYLAPAADEKVSDGDEIVVAQPVEVTVVDGGVAQPVVTNVLTAGALLRQMGIQLGPHDRVEPSIIAYPSSGSTISVVRVNEAIENAYSPIPFKKVTEKSDQLEQGQRKVSQAGAEGLRVRSYRVTYENGRVKSKVFVESKIVREPQDEITLIGTRKPVFVSHGSSDVGRASWYSASGLIAAHRSLPFGTVVKVTNYANGKSVTVTIRDRGPYVEGRIIDLSDDAFAEISSLGTGVIDVKIEW
ncbi:MAG: DUF348 domain-containing protein [Actinobacteria bacterium]|nr:DUF348 domain-containing protein [Actinomycetota bacterium]